MAVSPGALTERPRAPLAVKVIAFVALIFLLERAREIVLPVAIAIILTFLLAPLVRVLRNRGFNDALGAAVVVFGLLFIVGFLASRLVAPASEWIARAPTSVQQLIDSYERLRKSIPFIPPCWRWRPVGRACDTRSHEYAPTLIAAIVAVAAFYALFLRHPSGRLAAHDVYALRTFANFYVTVPPYWRRWLDTHFMRGPHSGDRRCSRPGGDFRILLLLQASDRPRAFLGGAAVLTGDLRTLLLAAAAAVGGGGRGWRARVVRPVLGGVFLAFLVRRTFAPAHG